MSVHLDHENVLETAIQWKAENKGVALATVVATWGSSPRPVGSQLVVNDLGDFLGSVSGGCIEGAVVMEAKEVINHGKPRLIDYGVSDEMAWEVGLACGGKCEVYINRIE